MPGVGSRWFAMVTWEGAVSYHVRPRIPMLVCLRGSRLEPSTELNWNLSSHLRFEFYFFKPFPVLPLSLCGSNSETLLRSLKPCSNTRHGQRCQRRRIAPGVPRSTKETGRPKEEVRAKAAYTGGQEGEKARRRGVYCVQAPKGVPDRWVRCSAGMGARKCGARVIIIALELLLAPSRSKMQAPPDEARAHQGLSAARE